MGETEESVNVIKETCAILNLTYGELGEILGVSESTLRSAASTGKVSRQTKKGIELYLTVVKLKVEIEAVNRLKKVLKELLV